MNLRENLEFLVLSQKTSEFSVRHSDQTPRFAVLSTVHNGELGVGKPQSFIKMRKENSQAFISEFLVLAIMQNGKLRVERPWKIILRCFQVFQELNG